MFNDRFGTNGLIKQELEEKKGATTPLLLKSVQFLVTFFLFSNTYLPTQCLRGRPCRAVAVAVGSRSCHLGQKVYQPRAMQRTKKKNRGQRLDRPNRFQLVKGRAQLAQFGRPRREWPVAVANGGLPLLCFDEVFCDRYQLAYLGKC